MTAVENAPALRDASPFQIAFVTRDIAGLAREYERLHAMSLPVRETGATLHAAGGTHRIAIKVALGWHGATQIELIEPVSGYDAFYREVLSEDDRPRFHHLGYRVHDWEAALAAARADGLAIVAAGEVGEVRFAYLDTRHLVGHYSEYIHKPAHLWPAFLTRPEAAAGSGRERT